jgi:hypothetical protein
MNSKCHWPMTEDPPLPDERDRNPWNDLAVRALDRKIRMRSPPGSQAFLDEYRGTIAGNSTPKRHPL